ncbi:synaptotagmin-11 isoform X2 [Alexandromys fortis]|uniref:synaptotagmin-11 isoform X2 n=1 Tax=Alexandromys fortis TaxID=100897 RepID=UPI002152E5B1|nr:synaptotagmin-11 isoform X2 [Microtus fortis]
MGGASISGKLGSGRGLLSKSLLRNLSGRGGVFCRGPFGERRSLSRIRTSLAAPASLAQSIPGASKRKAQPATGDRTVAGAVGQTSSPPLVHSRSLGTEPDSQSCLTSAKVLLSTASDHNMAEITNIRPSFDVSPVAAGLIGASVLVVCVSVTVFVWTCCHQQVEKKHKTPPYKFIHMLKGISIYPETLSNKKKIIKVRRDKDDPRRESGRGNLLVNAAESGLLGQEKDPRRPSSASCIDQLPIKVDCGEELRSPMTSLTPGESKVTSPSSPEEDVMLGSLTFSVDYNFPKKALVVTIQEAHGLPVMDDQTQGSDPYIKMTILPDKRHRVKTRVLRKTLDPVFDETFTFYGIPYSQLQDLVLHFLVLSFDRFSRDDVIGEVMVPLAGVDPSTGKVQLVRDIIKRNIQKCISRGELQVSLSYQPVAQRMTVVVLKARHLPKMDITGLSDPYVKVNVYYGRKRIAKKKTHVKKCTLNPVFNESFIYDIPTDLLPEISIEFLVIDFDRTTKNEVVGRLILGAHSVTASGAEHWREVCESPRKPVAKWHSLSEY